MAIWIEEIGVVDEIVGSAESRVESPGEVADLAKAARGTNDITRGLSGIVRRGIFIYFCFPAGAPAAPGCCLPKAACHQL